MSDKRWRTFVPGELPGQEMYHLLNALVVPRPIAWVSTLSERAVANLAPHSYFNAVCPDPPIIMFSSTGTKDTLRNLRHTGDFVVNIVPEALAEQMNLTAADSPPEVSEFAFAGLTPIDSDLVKAPRLLEAPASLECTVEREIELGNGPSTVVFGAVLRIHVAEDVMEDGRVSVPRFNPVGRLAGSGYVYSREYFNMPRPTWDQLQRKA